MSAITIRLSNHSDDLALARLAALDSARPLMGEVTVAEVGGRIVAALGSDGRSIADPFESSAALVELLRTHADGAGGARTRPGRRLPGRPAPLRAAA